MSVGRRGSAALVSVALAGCGGSSSIVAVASHPFPPGVIARAEQAMVRTQCTQPSGEQRIGSGFQVAAGIVTASHVMAPCAGGTASATVGAGVAAAVALDDPQHDYALLHSSLSMPRLRFARAPVSVGEQVVLLGIPGDKVTGNAFPEAVYGSVVATNQPVTLQGEQSEQLRDAIEVAIAAGSAVPGNSGGPAIDAAGRVVGVFEGATSRVAILTPATDLKLDSPLR
jgi:S1-C subfamily serine protease